MGKKEKGKKILISNQELTLNSVTTYGSYKKKNGDHIKPKIFINHTLLEFLIFQTFQVD